MIVVTYLFTAISLNNAIKEEINTENGFIKVSDISWPAVLA
jgi:hypothetical protein